MVFGVPCFSANLPNFYELFSVDVCHNFMDDIHHQLGTSTSITHQFDCRWLGDLIQDARTLQHETIVICLKFKVDQPIQIFISQKFLQFSTNCFLPRWASKVASDYHYFAANSDHPSLCIFKITTF